MNSDGSSPHSISQKDLTLGRRLSMKLEVLVVRRSCTELLDAPESAGEKEHQPCSSTSEPSLSKRDYLRRSTMMTAAASFADDHNNSKSSFHSPSGSDFYPNSSDRKLIHENITATRQIMDLKLQVADLLSANDTLAHEKRLLTDAKCRLEVDRADIKSDLDKTYECIGRLKKERDEAVRDLTRARMLQIREDSRKTMLLGNGTASNATTTDSVRSHASSCSSSNKSNTSGWFRRRNQPVESSSPSSTKDKISSTASNAIAALNESRSVFNIIATNDGTDSTICSEEQDKLMVTCMPGRRTSTGDPPRADPLGRRHTDDLLAEMQDCGTIEAPVLIRTLKVAEPTERNNGEGKKCRPRIERKDTESDVRAFLRDSFYDDDDDDDDDDDSVVKNETFTRKQSTLPFDDYQPQTKIGNGGSNKNATWDDGLLENSLPKRRSLNACEA